MDFGLGLVLSFTDNATGGMQNAINTLNSLTETASNASSSLSEMAQLGAFSVVANQLGSAMTSAGGRILSTFTEIIGKVNETGQTLMYAENQLNMLYRDSDKTGKQVLGDIANYAKQSLFEYEDLIPVVTMLKANGIEAFDSIASSTGNANQTLMDYAADLAAFNPQMRNAYGTGIKAAMGALNEYIAEGNARSLKSGASLDITGLLGEDKGATIEERSRQVADLMEKLNMVGISASLAESPMVKLGNISDTIFQFMGMVSESGVYETFTRMVSKLGDFVGSIPDSELQALAETVGSALSSLLRPIEWLEDKLIGLGQAFKDLAVNNPQLIKIVTICGALAGAFLVVGGISLKFMSQLGMLTMGLRMFSGTFSLVGATLKTGAMRLLGTLLPLTAAIGLIYLSWKNDFGGIRTLLTTFVANLQGAFNTARNAMNMNVNGMMGVITNLQNKGDFWSNITIGFIKIGTAAQALAEAWGDYTLSEDMFLKCKELGILPLIEAILDLKWRIEHFVQGFKEGFDTALTNVTNFFKGLAENLDGTIFDVIIDKATEFFQLLTNNDPEAWTKLGNIIGQVTAYAITAFAAFKVLSGVIGIVSKVIGVVIKVGSTVASVVGKIIGFIGKIIGAIKSVITFMVNNPITMVIAGIITAVASFVDMFINGFSAVKEVIMLVGIALATVGAILLGVAAFPAVVVAAIIAAVATIVILVKEHWTEICDFFSNLVENIGQFFSNLWENIKGVFSTIGEWFKSHIIDPVVNAFNAAKEVIVNAFLYVKETLQPIFDAIGNLLSSLKYLFETIWQAITIIVGNALQWVHDTISTIWQAIVDFLTPILEGIKTFFETIWNGISSFISSVMDTISNVISSVWNAIVSFLSPILSGIQSVVSNVWNSISSFISGVMNTISSTISSIWSNIVSGVSQFVTNIYDNVKQGFDNAVEFITGLASQAIGWGADFIQGIVDGIASKINAVADAVKGVADKIKSFLHFSVPDEGPLTDYESWMPDFMTGLADSITANQDVVTEAITNFTEQVKTSLTQDTQTAFQQFGTQWQQNMQVIVTSTQTLQTGVQTALQGVLTVVQTSTQAVGSGGQQINVVLVGIVQSFNKMQQGSTKAFAVIVTGFTQVVSASQNVGNGYSSVLKTMVSTTQTSATGMTNTYKTMLQTYTRTVTQMVTISTTQYGSMTKTTTTAFGNMSTAISQSMQKAVQAVQNAVNTMKSAMNFQWSIPHLKLPHINVSGKFNVDPPTAPSFSVDWYAKGGVFDEPSVIGVGEQGKEAVMPLENNTGWISDLAYMLSAQIVAMQRDFTPVDSSQTFNEGSTSSDRYMTSNVTNDNRTTSSTNDNSVTFNEGAIQINCQNASEEEAMRMAKIIMEYIKRQKELDKMLAYG